MHEVQCHEVNSFLTLTYDDAYLPPGGRLVKKDWQDFMKRLRDRFQCYDVTLGHHVPRFFMCGEYGELRDRPHFHACCFGLGFPDKVYWKKSPSGAALFRSAMLEKLWPFGHSSVGNVTFESAAYVARYVMKKRLGRDAVEDGEFSLRSLKPGLGRFWLDRFWSDVFPHGRVTVRGGRDGSAPRYYDIQMEKLDPVLFAAMKDARRLEMEKRWDDNSPARLRVKEQVLRARVRQLKRSMK